MQKLKLHLEQLSVESSGTTTAGWAEGTVHGAQATYYTECTCPGVTNCGQTCADTCAYTCDDATCNNTCGGPTCDGTCGFTCGMSCYPTCRAMQGQCNAPF